MVKVVLLHPDLGIGGAERAAIDAALALKSKGHEVQFVTAHHDPNHCFQETIDGNLKVTAVGDWLPRSIFGKCYAICAYLRMIYAAVYLVFFSGIRYDVVFCDQISACIPVLKTVKTRVLFYCHFPDLLLTQRKSFLKKLYRAPIDWAEEKSTGMADCVLVNSKFTGEVFKETFKSLSALTPVVLYPIPDFTALDKPADPPTPDLIPPDKETIFLSINRYERKKNLHLAIQAMARLKDYLDSLDGIHLIMAGGYDERVVENKEYFLALKNLAEELEVADNITFVRSFSDSQKRTLLRSSTCLLYTPDREHFGIVPIESMYNKCPVIAVNSGGPLETVAHGSTGFLCKQTDSSFAKAMIEFVRKPYLSKKMGEAGRERMIEKFSFSAFSDQLDNIITKLMSKPPTRMNVSMMKALFLFSIVLWIITWMLF